MSRQGWLDLAFGAIMVAVIVVGLSLGLRLIPFEVLA